MSAQRRRTVVSATITDEGRVVSLVWSDGGALRFHAVWLLDCALDPSVRDPRNGQRLVTLTGQPSDPRIAAAHLDDELVHFTLEPGGRALTYSADWLREHAYDGPHSTTPGRLPGHVQTWDASSADVPLTTAFDDFAQSDDALAEWLGAVHRHGVGRIVGGPVAEGALFDVVARFSHVRETNYGRHFEVRTEANPVNLAFTRDALPAHTDNPYRDQQPTLQLLYCLDNSAKGGESVVVDGFRAVEILEREQPGALALLSGHCARYAYAGDASVHLESRQPMIELAPDGELRAVRMNNRSIAPLRDVPFERMVDYYGAYRAFEAIVARESLHVTFELAPGECFLVDNTRVMHSRMGFAAAGSRWLQGCYADREGLRSKLAVLNARDGM